MLKGKLELNDMVFFSHHGCFKEEQIIGNKFIVNFSCSINPENPAYTDDLNDAIDYQVIYQIIAEQMKIQSHLLEHLCGRILNKIRNQFPSLEDVSLSISKINPPLGGQIGASKITLSY